MVPLFCDEVAIPDNQTDQIESASASRHVANIERHMLSLRMECFVAMLALIGVPYGAVYLLHQIGWWSWAWAACIGLYGIVAFTGSIPWMNERLLRSNTWADIRQDHLYMMDVTNELEKQFTNEQEHE